MAKAVIANEEEHENFPTSSRPAELDECEDEEEEEDKLSDDDDDDDDNSELDECEDGGVDEDIYEVEQFKVDGRHFSHNHRLSLFISSEEEEDKVGDDDDDSFCRICGLPIFISTNPAYTCTKANNACKFFLHQQCALKLPPKLIHPTHCPDRLKHSLRIVKRPSSTKFMTYKCEDCYDFKIHPLVAVSGVEIKLIKHKSHPSHEMVVVCQEISCECGACGRIQQGFFFACHHCNFWIHQDCTTLPNVVTFAAHPHPFILAYSLPPDQVREQCIVCGKQLLLRNNGIYFCPQTTTFAHAACGMEKFASKTNRLELMQLPDDELINAFPVSVIRRYAETMKPLSPNVHGIGDELMTIDKYHNHPLILTRQVNSSTTTTKACINLACDLCTRPINLIHEALFPYPILFYKCVDNDCHFIAHKICWDILPMTLKFVIPGLEDHCPARIYPDVRSYMFSSIFHCRFCHRPCNGLCYYFPNEDDDAPLMLDDQLPFFFDIECMAAPATVNHASHAQHILFRTNRLMEVTPLTCCRDDLLLLYDVYRCITCEYFIHIRCAMLPKTIVYPQYHHHPLHLIFTTATATGTGRDHEYEYEYEYEDSSSFCEVCEEDIDLKYWFYHCSECDQSFHINCIPSVGHLSKVKFGKTYSLPDSHSHPLKLKRMLTLHSQRCGHCKRIIQGLVDQIAFFCSRCHFWLHFSCAAAAHNKTTSNKFMKLFSDFDDNLTMEHLKIDPGVYD